MSHALGHALVSLSQTWSGSRAGNFVIEASKEAEAALGVAQKRK